MLIGRSLCGAAGFKASLEAEFRCMNECGARLLAAMLLPTAGCEGALSVVVSSRLPQLRPLQ